MLFLLFENNYLRCKSEAALSYQNILKELKNKEYKPLYFLHGEEGYFIDRISGYIEQSVLDEEQKGFNQTILYGKDTDFMTVVDTATRYPMMAPYQVLILKEAQDMKELESLESYIANPVKTTILVICHKHKYFRRFNTKFGKLLKKNAVVLESKPLYQNKIPDWINAYLKQHNLSIHPQVSALIAEYLGTDLSKISNELDKLALNLPAGTQINRSHVERHIGISKDYNIFELQKAVAAKDIVKANRIVHYFAANSKKHPIQMVISVFANFFTKVYKYHFVKMEPKQKILSTLGLRSDWFLRDYQTALRHFDLEKTEQVIALLSEYDLKSKGVDFNTTTTEDGSLLKEMIWKILH